MEENMMPCLKMVTVQEKSMCVLWFPEKSPLSECSVVTELNYRKDPPSDNAIRRPLKQFQETGSVLRRKESESQSTSQDVVD
jgi:hypothetical protein